jgi:hypothetical protein
LLASAAALPLVATASAAQDKTQAAAPMEMKSTGTPGQVAGARSFKVAATVKALDLANREITLEGPRGKSETFKVGAEVRNLDQVHVGDSVVVKYTQGLLMQMQAPGEAPVQPEAGVAAERAAPGAAPGAAMAATVRATVTIKEIDPKSRMVTLEGPEGNLYRVKAGPKVHLEKAKVGDKLAATYAEAVAVTVEPATKAKSGKPAPAKQ